jgi:hypothetical protein
MKFRELLEITRQSPVFSTGLLMVGKNTDIREVRVQLSRWVAEGRIIKLRRSRYVIAEPYVDGVPHPFVLANAIDSTSYVSCQSALSWYNLIPEYVPSITSVTSTRSGTISNPLGTFIYRHIKFSWMKWFESKDLGGGESAKVALPEKALLDLIYLEPHSDSPGYLRQLRLQNTELIKTETLQFIADDSGKPKLRRAAAEIIRLITQ